MELEEHEVKVGLSSVGEENESQESTKISQDENIEASQITQVEAQGATVVSRNSNSYLVQVPAETDVTTQKGKQYFLYLYYKLLFFLFYKLLLVSKRKLMIR
jgi:hypothetical protein